MCHEITMIMCNKCFCAANRKLQYPELFKRFLLFFISIIFSYCLLIPTHTECIYLLLCCGPQHALPVFICLFSLSFTFCTIICEWVTLVISINDCHCSVFSERRRFISSFNSHAHNAHPFTYVLQFWKFALSICGVLLAHTRTRNRKLNEEFLFHFNWIWVQLNNVFYL